MRTDRVQPVTGASGSARRSVERAGEVAAGMITSGDFRVGLVGFGRQTCSAHRERLGWWLDFAAHLLTDQTVADPLGEMCRGVSDMFDGSLVGVLDHRDGSVDIHPYTPERKPDVKNYVDRVGGHPLATYFMKSGADSAATMHDIGSFRGDRNAEALDGSSPGRPYLRAHVCPAATASRHDSSVARCSG